MFPLNPDVLHDIRHTEKFQVNFAHTENYKNSAVPFCQRLLNQDNIDQKEKERARREQQQARARAGEGWEAGGAGGGQGQEEGGPLML